MSSIIMPTLRQCSRNLIEIRKNRTHSFDRGCFDGWVKFRPYINRFVLHTRQSDHFNFNHFDDDKQKKIVQLCVKCVQRNIVLLLRTVKIFTLQLVYWLFVSTRNNCAPYKRGLELLNGFVSCSIFKGKLNPKIDFSSFEHLGIVEQLYEIFLSC